MALVSIYVRLMSGPHDGQQLEFSLPGDGGEIVLTIGRGEDCDISLPYDSQVSRTHARLVYVRNDETMDEGRDQRLLIFQLVDVGSRNGTYLGEKRLKDQGAELVPGELFRVGRTWLRVEQ